MPGILDEIADYKRGCVEDAKALQPIEEIKLTAADVPPARDFGGALIKDKDISLIAEVKRASPSKGVFREDFDPEEIARIYEENGATAISVLTDEKYFGGRPEHIGMIKSVSNLPALRKDFIVDEYQIYEARILEADAILLIAAILSDPQLRNYSGLAERLEMSALVEVHTEEELNRALDAGARIIGINNRDLRVFTTDLKITFDLIDKIPEDRTVVSESGINTREDVLRLKDAGADAILVGEALIRERDIGKKVRELLGKNAR